MRAVYLDNAATTRVRPEVADLVRHIMEEDYANPSSMHIFGVKAEKYVNDAAAELAHELRAKTREIIFNSGGTEGANAAIIGTALKKASRGHHIISTPIEHPAVLNTLKFLKGRGFEISLAPVDTLGRVDIDGLTGLVRPDTILVSVMSVNNEIGTAEDIAGIARAVKKINPSVYIHTDAVQAFGKFRLAPGELGVDLMTTSAHKIHGPKGVGMMYVNEKTPVEPVIWGGGQQRGLRSGTLNVPGIAGMALAAKLYREERADITARMRKIRARLVERLTAMDAVTVIGSGASPDLFAPHILSASFEGVRAEVLLHALEERGIYVSAGSACSSHHPAPSATLTAIGLRPELIESTLRLSLGIYNDISDADIAADAIEELLPGLRRYVRH